MKWQGRRQSTNVSDQRNSSNTGKIAAGGLGSLVVIGLLLFGLFTGFDTSGLANLAGQIAGGVGQTTTAGALTSGDLTQEQQDQLDYIETILADSEDVWTQVFADNGMTYRPSKLVLFSGSIQTPSGLATSASGPFYSPADETIYLDLSFFNDLQIQYGANVQSNIAGVSGDFVVAYVICHEVGHHVQNLLGVLSDVSQAQARLSTTQGNKWSVACELQADYYAGVFAHYEDQLGYLEPGDINAAVTAAEAIGDDSIQEQSYGYAKPDTFTHGTSQQRADWFTRGYQLGTLDGGDTFAVFGLN